LKKKVFVYNKGWLQSPVIKLWWSIHNRQTTYRWIQWL